MNCCYVDKIKVNSKIQYFIRSSDDLSIIKEPSKYLKHKMKTNNSPNTIRRIAYALVYYIQFLSEKGLSTDEVLLLKYAEQHEHFIEFLHWLQMGNHTERDKFPMNHTCNQYLQSVFGYYEFILLEYEKDGDIKVLEARELGYSGSVGVRFSKSVNTFRGYLPVDDSVGRTTNTENIVKTIKATQNIRNILMILLLAETGFRIGELLGIKYSQDIDFQNRTLQVVYREDNENESRAKNAEYRKAKVSKDTMDLLLLYISENRKLLEKTEFLFVNQSGPTEGEPMTVNGVYSVLREIEKKTGVKITPHMLRHYFANERRKSGWDLNMISHSLGHRHISTTERYINIEDVEMAEAMDEFYEKNNGLFDISKLV